MNNNDFHKETIDSFKDKIQVAIDKKLGNLTPSRSQYFTTSLAKEALFEISKINEMYGTRVFLNGGGLLGVIREGDLLSHDYDLDVGFIVDEIEPKSLQKIFEATENFKLLSSIPEQFIVSYKGLVIDVYAHFDDGKGNLNMITAMHTWNHEAFELKKIAFANTKIYIPANPEKYLSECYGDWHNKKLMFDFSYDTPNRGYRGTSGLIYLLTRLENAILYGWDSYASLAVSALYKNYHIDYRHIFPMPTVNHPADYTHEQTKLFVISLQEFTPKLIEKLQSEVREGENFVVGIIGEWKEVESSIKLMGKLSFVTQVFHFGSSNLDCFNNLFPNNTIVYDLDITKDELEGERK